MILKFRISDESVRKTLNPLDQITLRQLRALQAVVSEGTISAAAARLGLTGPAIHNQLKLLEDSVESALLVREGHGRGTPTPQGAALLTAYEEAHTALERAVQTIRALNAGKIGSVTLGVVSTAKYVAPGIVARLKSEMPDVEVRLKVANRADTIEALGKGEYDLCIMGRPPQMPKVDATPLVDHPHVIIAAADHPLADKDTVTADDLGKELFVTRETGSGTRILAAHYLNEIGNGREFQTIEMTSNETIKQAVLSGLGIALISAHTVAEELRTGRLVSLPCDGMPIIRRWFLCAPTERPPGMAALKVREWISANAETIFPAFDVMKRGRG
ncbi:HTH-type transcriptional activator CmpR [Hartmannibacter diazotrophicus]|uniref:HTH-type transcriptional regulator CbbR n=1 Tax=Hartmannibacter diazotrophicus TaxID=1482074 RepID=A0A2C9DAT9_9HYPH|nr:LysR family transcriptional regulator [Hartmannibacter diazotrophicus]SON57407.1 HTH-type transcriptional activator CmpR [Hartmannibacter diazotrophicus]